MEALRLIIQKLFFTFASLISVLAVGVIGYMWLENYTFINAMYMTIITLSSVGFMEVEPLSEMGRIFTSILILVNIGVFAYGVSTITVFFVEGTAARLIQEIKIKKNWKG